HQRVHQRRVHVEQGDVVDRTGQLRDLPQPGEESGAGLAAPRTTRRPRPPPPRSGSAGRGSTGSRTGSPSAAPPATSVARSCSSFYSCLTRPGSQLAVAGRPAGGGLGGGRTGGSLRARKRE